MVITKRHPIELPKEKAAHLQGSFSLEQINDRKLGDSIIDKPSNASVAWFRSLRDRMQGPAEAPRGNGCQVKIEENEKITVGRSSGEIAHVNRIAARTCPAIRLAPRYTHARKAHCEKKRGGNETEQHHINTSGHRMATY